METSFRLSIPEIEDRVCDIVSSHFRLPRGEINPQLRLLSDLHIDSLDIVELMMAIEDEFAVSLPDGIDGDMAYKSVFTRKDFRLSDFAELVYFRQGIEPPVRRRLFRPSPTVTNVKTTSFTQLGGRVESHQYRNGVLLEPLGKNSSGFFTYRRRTDGMVCVQIPTATVTIGTNNPTAMPDERPARLTKIESFLIDQEPVSTTAYCRFLNSTEERDESTLEKWFMLSTNDKRHQHVLLQKSSCGWEPLKGTECWPMMLVSWFGANAYSCWAHRHFGMSHDGAGEFLPSEAQWEYAARGKDPKKYPWGDADPTHDLATFAEHVRGQSYRADKLPVSNVNAELGMSPFGLHHMAGNVWQWCRDWYGPGIRSERGGSWVGPDYLCRSSYRRGRTPTAKGRCLGFRCVSTIPN